MWRFSEITQDISFIKQILEFIGATIAHLDNKFMSNPFWLFVSGCGVFGVVWHMQLLNTNKNNRIFWTGVFIWFSPYIGYLDFNYIPFWDNIVNSVSLFSMWFFNWFVAIQIYELINMKILH